MSDSSERIEGIHPRGIADASLLYGNHSWLLICGVGLFRVNCVRREFHGGSQKITIELSGERVSEYEEELLIARSDIDCFHVKQKPEQKKEVPAPFRITEGKRKLNINPKNE